MASLIDVAVPAPSSNDDVKAVVPTVPETISSNTTAAPAATTTPNSAIADVFVFHHPECYDHNIHDHPEQPDRVATILATLRNHFPDAWFKEAPMATDEQLMLFHTPEYVAMMKRLCTKAEKGPPFELVPIDSDTILMRKTRNAAYRAAGSIVAAVDAVIGTPDGGSGSNDGRARSAFCCVRPPGHHAERDRACGFCFFSNAAIGAR